MVAPSPPGSTTPSPHGARDARPVFFGADIAFFHDRKGITASESLLAGADCSCPRVFYQGVDTCSENAGTLPGGFTRKRCFE